MQGWAPCRTAAFRSEVVGLNTTPAPRSCRNYRPPRSRTLIGYVAYEARTTEICERCGFSRRRSVSRGRPRLAEDQGRGRAEAMRRFETSRTGTAYVATRD